LASSRCSQAWDLAPQKKYPEGSVVTGKVVRITTFGAFVELEPGVDGLVHISQCALTRINKVEDAVNVGDVVNVKVLSIDPEAKRISLSIRALLEQERKEAAETAEEEPKADEGRRSRRGRHPGDGSAAGARGLRQRKRPPRCPPPPRKTRNKRISAGFSRATKPG
jgi:predicted RNA-binding protein with RPS1 domain